MVNLDEIKKKEETILVNCRLPKKYKDIFDEKEINFTGFVIQACKETFDD